MERDNHQIRFIIVPDFILRDSNILDGQKLLFGEIASNSLEKGYCWFSNEYIMDRYNIARRTASRWVNELKHHGYITIELVRRDGTKEIMERRIRVNTLKPILADYMQWYCQRRQQVRADNDNPPIATDDAENSRSMNKIILNDITNVLLSSDEYEVLVAEFGKRKLEAGIAQFSHWKLKTNAHPRSDFGSIRKWLSRSRQSQSRVSSIEITGSDSVTDEMLGDLPF